MCEITNKGTCFCRCLFLVEMRGSILGANCAPLSSRSRQSTGLSLCTAPTSIPLSPFCKRTNKKEALAFLQVLLFLVEMRGIEPLTS